MSNITVVNKFATIRKEHIDTDTVIANASYMAYDEITMSMMLITMSIDQKEYSIDSVGKITLTEAGVQLVNELKKLPDFIITLESEDDSDSEVISETIVAPIPADFDKIEAKLIEVDSTGGNTDTKEEREKILLEMHNITVNAVNTDPDSNENSVLKRLQKEIDNFTFEFKNYQDTDIKETFTKQKEIFTNGITTNKSDFDKLLAEEKLIIEEKFGSEYNYSKILHPIYSDHKHTKQTLSIGNKTHISFADTLSFSSGNYINVNLKLKDDTNISMQEGNSTSYTNVNTIDSTSINEIFKYSDGNVDNKNTYDDYVSSAYLFMLYSNTKAKNFHTTDSSGLYMNNNNILFSFGICADDMTTYSGIGLFIYVNPWQFSFWGYFSIIRGWNSGHSINTMITNVIELNWLSENQEDILMMKQFLSDETNTSFETENIVKLSKIFTKTGLSKHIQKVDNSNVIKLNDNLLLGAQIGPLPPPGVVPTDQEPARKKLRLNFLSVGIFAVMGAFFSGLSAVLFSLAVDDEKADDKADEKLSETLETIAYVPQGIYLFVWQGKIEDNGKITVEGTTRTEATVKITINKDSYKAFIVDDDGNFTKTYDLMNQDDNEEITITVEVTDGNDDSLTKSETITLSRNPI